MVAEAIGSGLGLVSGLVNLFRAGQERKKLEEVLKNMPESQANKIMGLASTQLQGRAPGAAQQERNIFQSGATAMGRTTQAATSSADVLQQSANIQAQTNKALENLGMMDIQDYQRRLSNYEQAAQAKAAEDWRRYQTETQIRGAQNETFRNALMNLQDTGMGIAYLGSKGAYAGLFGKGGNKGDIASQSGLSSSKAAPSQNMLYGTGGSITESPVIGGTTPSYFSSLIGRTPISNEEANYGMSNPYMFTGFRKI